MGGREGGIDVKVRLLSCFFRAQVFGTPWLVLRWLPSRVDSCFFAMQVSNVMLGVCVCVWEGVGSDTDVNTFFGQDIPLFRLNVSAMDAYAFEVSLVLAFVLLLRLACVPPPAV